MLPTIMSHRRNIKEKVEKERTGMGEKREWEIDNNR